MAFEFFKKLKKKLFQSSSKSIKESQTSDLSFDGDQLEVKKNDRGDAQNPKAIGKNQSEDNNFTSQQ